MRRYLLRRAVLLIPQCLGITVLTFALLALAPGDPAATLAALQYPGTTPPQEAVLALREELHLNDPLPVRYAAWLSGVVRGDLGLSLRTGKPLAPELVRRLPPTLLLAGAALALALAVALPLGVAGARWRGARLDVAGRGGALVATAVPGYVLATVLVLLFAVQLRWLPAFGYGTPQHLVLPAVVLAAGAAGPLLRLTRAAMLDVLGRDYLRTAHAKGLSEARVLTHHALRNAMLPVCTALGIQVGHLLGGAVIVETIFSWPGVGKYAIDAVFLRDYPVVQSVTLYLTLVFLLVSLLVDVAYRRLDPRLHLEGA